MTLYEIAQRLGVHETAVRTVEERENDLVVTLRDERRMLVSETTARAYLPEIDDVPEPVKESDDGADTDSAEKLAMAEPTRRPVKRTQGKAK